ncbi:3-methyladenine DNA glycosylase [Kineococcus gynurae]|uniref:3-methyladenine DNA glycosylase n=1 Tax=Kineococcus gynurae TaxID=452979 RepID=A0ABV5LS08_9ACTN
MLASADWQRRAEAHAARADALTAAVRERRERGETHAVEDFLHTYYAWAPGRLRRWHPGLGVELRGAEERVGWAGYRSTGGGVVVDGTAFAARRSATLRQTRDVLAGTLARPAQLGCFGLHEWAMVYRSRPEEIRHSRLPLRLGSAGTDAVVEGHRIRCSHFDAFRFFTPEAEPRNEVHPTREQAPRLEQPGCLHATMDCYRWAMKLSPAVAGETLLDCYELARDVRVLDMRASPYDVSSYGLEPVRIETPEGKTTYAAAQRAFAARAEPLRRTLLAVCDELLALIPA